MNDNNQRPGWMIEGSGEWETGTDAGLPPKPTCGLWWTLTTLATALAIGAALGVVLWLVLT